MAAVGVLKALTWVLKYLARGLSIVGLAMHGCPTRRDEPETGLTPDELLWQAELAESGSGRRPETFRPAPEPPPRSPGPV